MSRYVRIVCQTRDVIKKPYEAVEGDLRGLETALKQLRSGKSNATKPVTRIPDMSDLKICQDEKIGMKPSVINFGIFRPSMYSL